MGVVQGVRNSAFLVRFLFVICSLAPQRLRVKNYKPLATNNLTSCLSVFVFITQTTSHKAPHQKRI